MAEQVLTSFSSGKIKKAKKYDALLKRIAFEPYRTYEVDLTSSFESFRTHLYKVKERVQYDLLLSGNRDEAEVLSHKISIMKMEGGRVAKVFMKEFLPTREIKDPEETEETKNE